MKKKYILFGGHRCEVIERYTITKKEADENGLYFRKRIKFIDQFGNVIDCADTFK